MLKKDILVRQLEEMGKVLAQLLTFRKNKDWDHFEQELSAAVKRYTPLEIEKVEAMSGSEFTNNIVLSDSIGFDQKKILATLLFEKMNYYLSVGFDDQYQQLKEKCLSLYEFLANDLTENEYNLDIHYKLKYLRDPD
jgi:hypothetical protein